LLLGRPGREAFPGFVRDRERLAVGRSRPPALLTHGVFQVVPAGRIENPLGPGVEFRCLATSVRKRLRGPDGLRRVEVVQKIRLPEASLEVGRGEGLVLGGDRLEGACHEGKVAIRDVTSSCL
jgi:hypothetical protein